MTGPIDDFATWLHTLEARVTKLEAAPAPAPAPTPTPTPTPAPAPAPVPTGPVIAFPGAQGFGRFTKGGRGGALIRVTNLNDSGPGSLRAALTAAGPRIVVFEVGGSIDVLSPIAIVNPLITIAGQSAPPPGVQVRYRGPSLTGQGTVLIRCGEVIMQHLPIRGESLQNTVDSLSIDTNAGLSNSQNIIIDHCTLQWAGDENLGASSSNFVGKLAKLTIQYCMLAESVESAILVSNGQKETTLYANLFAKNHDRHPRADGAQTEFECVNCISYNVRLWDVDIGDSGVTAAHAIKVALINNRYIVGPSTALTIPIVQWRAGAWAGGSQLYAVGNVQSGTQRTFFGNLSAWDPIVAAPPPGVTSGISDLKAADAAFESWLLARVGARPNSRDAAAQRVITDTINRTGVVPSDKASKLAFYGAPIQYMPTTRPFVASADPNGDANGNGWTNIEEQLHAMSAALIP